MSNQVEFRTAVMGGFDKNDVLEYIAQMVRQNKNNEEKSKKEIESLKQEKEEWMNREGELEKTIRILQDELRNKGREVEQDEIAKRETDNKLEDLKREILDLRKELEKKREEMREKNEDLLKSQEQIRSLTYKYDKLEEKCMKYEQSVMQIGTAMVNAQNKADVIVLEAKNKVKSMSEETDIALRMAADKLDAFKMDVNKLKEVIQNQMSGLIGKVSSIDNTVEMVQNKFVNYFIETKNMLDNEEKKYGEQEVKGE